MPDHLHLLAFASQRLERALGSYIGIFKANIRKAWNHGNIFERDFYDRIVRPCHSLNDIYEYIRNNPRRLLIRRERPEFFTRVREVFIDGEVWEAYGNLQLLRNPFKEAVVVHRKESVVERSRNAERWFHLAANGGVVVSPFISKDEKKIRDEIDSLGGKYIRIMSTAMGERFKPGGHEFELCEEGRLLLIAPKSDLQLDRETCLKLNHTAGRIIEVPAELLLRRG